jgi:hypothetical protein
MRSEKAVFNIESRLPYLPPLRGEHTPLLRPGLDALRIVWWMLKRGDARNPPGYMRPAGHSGYPRL